MEPNQSTAPAEPSSKPQIKVAEQPSDELLQTISSLFGADFDQKGLLEERAASGLAPHYQPGETLLMANTVKLRRTGCLGQAFGMPDTIYCVAVTDQRVLMAPINFVKPSSKATIYTYDQLAGMYTKNGSKGRYWILESKNDGVIPLFATWIGCGPGAEDFLKAMFAHFYGRAKQIVVPPDYAGRDVSDALRANKLTVIISQ